ncbi:hypothetical protein D3H64_01000 [Atopobacter sp. AH10]|uniref:hypothetical protein n=1 Tax=Atopobacter sp. AH10 TaxID=2315861 RepID=UPI000EF28750|nr:hypothetical protein [Atopobacter sp. AH10]RLK64135.1 hypothetical protein D3H64_01000 [Atopobacter sp. AH10]
MTCSSKKFRHYTTISLLAIGAIALSVKYYLDNRLLDPDKLLKETTKRIIKQETVTGSWINYIAETVIIDGQEEKIYQGAIQIATDNHQDKNENINYHFTINAKTGKLLSFKKV